MHQRTLFGGIRKDAPRHIAKGHLILGDRLDTRMMIGAVVALAGVLIIALRPNRAAPRVILIRERG